MEVRKHAMVILLWVFQHQLAHVEANVVKLRESSWEYKQTNGFRERFKNNSEYHFDAQRENSASGMFRLMFRAISMFYCSVVVILCSFTTGALGIPSLLLSCSIPIIISLHITIILTMALMSFYQTTSLHLYIYRGFPSAHS